MIEPLAVAVHGVKQMGDVTGMKIAVLGAGPIGNLVAQTAKGMGADKVMITDVSDLRLEKAKECGIDVCVNTAKKDFGEAMIEAFGPDKADVIYDCAGNNITMGQAIKYARKGSTIVSVAGFCRHMSRTPILTIGTGSNTQTAEFKYRSTVDGKRTFVADIKINNDILGLADGTQIPFTVTNAFDLAGNEAVLDNEDVTFTSKYGQVTYDNNAPEMAALGILNDTHYNEGKDVTVATTGDRIRLRVAFKEMLAVNP